MTVEQYFIDWLDRQKVDWQKSTYEANTVYFYKHIIPWFAERVDDISKLTAKDINDYIIHIKTSGRLDGKSGGLSDASVKKHLSLIKQALNEAVVLGYINTNPALSVKLRRSKKHVSAKHVIYTTAEAFRVLKTFEGHRLYLLVKIALFYGLRRSEVLGLRWSAIDFEKNELRIEHTIVKSLTIEAKDSTKTDESCATFELLPDIKADLQKTFENRRLDSKYIFTWDDGRVYRPDYITKAFTKHLKKCGLPIMRFHDLRHSTASILFDSGKSLEFVKAWLRHKDIETTSNIYLHYSSARKKICAGEVAEVFSITAT